MRMPVDAQLQEMLIQIKSLGQGGNILMLIWGAALVFSMHAGFAFLEAGSVRRKNVVNALTKIVMDWSVSTLIYFVIGFPIAYGISFLMPVNRVLDFDFNFVRFFFLLCFAACIPAIISGGIAERAKFGTQVLAGAVFVGLMYPLFESLVWCMPWAAGWRCRPLSFSARGMAATRKMATASPRPSTPSLTWRSVPGSSWWAGSALTSPAPASSPVSPAW
jgi:hypothetical protein